MPKVYIVESYDEHSYIEKVYGTREKAEEYAARKKDIINRRNTEANKCYECSFDDYKDKNTCPNAVIVKDWDGECCENEVHEDFPVWYRISERELE